MAKVYLFLGNEEYLNKVKIERIIKESVADEYNINYYDMEEKTLVLQLKMRKLLLFV